MLISSIDSRLVYRNAIAAFQKAKVPVQRNDLSNAYLRFEVPLSSTQTSYDVPITITQTFNGNAVASTEQRLELQDSFFVSHMGYFLVVSTTSGGYTGLQDILYTFPASAWSTSIDLDRINLFWNGFLKLTVNNVVICPQWDLRRHYVAPTTQRPMNVVGTTFPWAFTDQNDGSQDGFYPVEPNWVLIGSRNNQMQINYPRPFDSTVFTGAGSLSVRAVIIVRGVLAQNSTPVR